MKKTFIYIMSFAVGVMAANLYYPQSILANIADSLGLRTDAAGLIMTLTQVGYGLGVLFVVPLGDLVENKKLILLTITVTILSEFTLGVSHTAAPYFAASVAAGIGASTVQILVPYATHLYPPGERGRVIGSLMSGLMVGIMLSRPLASILTDMIDLHAVFFVSAGLMLLLVWILSASLPKRKPESGGMTYMQLIWSMTKLVRHQAVLRRRGIYQSLMFGAFCVFWTTVPLLLMRGFGFTQKGVAVFALVGVAGAIVAPLAGRVADRGFSRQASLAAFGLAILSFALSHFCPVGGWGALLLLALTANMLDAGVSAHLVLGQRAIFMIDPNNQSRLNGLYLATVYIGGSVGSALGAWAYLHGGWGYSTMIGLLFPLAALILMLTEKISGYGELY